MKEMHPFPAKLVLGAQSRGKALDAAKVSALTGSAVRGRSFGTVVAGFHLAKDERLWRKVIGQVWVRTGEPGEPMRFTDAERDAAQAIATTFFPQVQFAIEGQDKYSRRMFFRLIIVAKKGHSIEGLRAGIDLFSKLSALEAESPEYVAPPKAVKQVESKPVANVAAKVGLGSFMRK